MRASRRGAATAAAAAALLLAASSAGAQAAATRGAAVLAGTVVREPVAGDTAAPTPIAGARVTIAALRREARADARGRFVLAAVPAGEHAVEVRGVGFEPLRMTAELRGADTTWVDVALSPPPPALAAVRTTGARTGRLADFERRRERAIGTFLTQATLDSAQGRELSALLRMQPGIRLIEFEAGKLAVGSRRGAASSVRSAQNVCYYQVFFDGIRIFAPTSGAPTSGGGSQEPPDIDQWDLSQLAGVEVYEGAARTPAEYNSSAAACGTIVLWTRRD